MPPRLTGRILLGEVSISAASPATGQFRATICCAATTFLKSADISFIPHSGKYAAGWHMRAARQQAALWKPGSDARGPYEAIRFALIQAQKRFQRIERTCWAILPG
jgi:hypothetical protein